MTKETVECVIEEQIQPIFGFCLKKCAKIQDAEDLTQEIVFKAFKTLVVRDDIEDISKFIWTIAHNTLANYYRDKNRKNGVSVDALENVLADGMDVAEGMIERETYEKLRKEIAYLSKQQRRILIAYYYENKKQEEIAKELNIPIGTVKWHLFEAKKELKRSMETVRTIKQLQFNPIRFSIMGFNGSSGTMGGTEGFFRSILSQNIAYSVYRKAKSIHEIADELGVSPVYVESDVEFLEKYGYLIKNGDKYLANMLMDDPNDPKSQEIMKMHNEMYEKVAKLYANALYEALLQDGVLESAGIESCYKEDKNFLLWALFPYVAAISGKKDPEEKIKFEEVATVRADGAHDIANIVVEGERLKQMKYYDSMQKWCGPSWAGDEAWMVWKVHHEWAKDIDKAVYWSYFTQRVLKPLERLGNGEALSVDECAQLSEQGMIRMIDGKPQYAVVHIKDEATKQRLLGIGTKLKEEFHYFNDLKEPFSQMVLRYCPKQVRKMQEYQMQYMFYADSWFLLHCIKELLNNGKLQLPTEEQRKSISTLHIPI